MKHKFFKIFLILTTALVLVSCNENKGDVNISINSDNLILEVNETHQITFETDDLIGLDFISLDEKVVTVNNEGLVKAIGLGTTSIKVTSKSNKNISVLINVTVQEERIKIDSSKKNIDLYIEDTYEIQFETNDLEGVVFSSSNNDILTVDEEGVVTALKIGTALVKLTSKTDDSIELIITFNITDYFVINYVLAEGMKVDLDDELLDLEADIGNIYVVNINEDGQLEALFKGETKIFFMENGKINTMLNIQVMNRINSIKIDGPTEIYKHDNIDFNFQISPTNGFNLVKYSVEDENILKYENGQFKPLSVGTTIVKVQSEQSDDLFDTIEITIKDTILVSKEKQVRYGNWDFKENIDIFESFEDAIKSATANSKIILLDGNYNTDITIDKDLYILGEQGIITGEVMLDSKKITIDNVLFQNESKIYSTSKLETFYFTNNIVKNINKPTFMELSKYKEINISNNKFKNVLDTTIHLNYIDKTSVSLIEKNEIEDTKTAIKINALERMSRGSAIRIYRNTIKNLDNAIYLDLNGANENSLGEIYARFNEISNYNKAVISNDDNNFDFTFNYWGSANINIDDFENVDEKYLLESYSKPEDILEEEKYRYGHPIVVKVNNYIDSIKLGETHKIELIILPYNSKSDNVLLFVDNEEILSMSRTYELIPVRSGIAKLTASPLFSRENEIIYEVEVTTDPGIHFELNNPTYDLEVGDEFNIKATPYPYNLANEKVVFQSSNSNIAKVDQTGKVDIVGAGAFSITAKITSPIIVEEVLEFQSVNEFDENNIMDFITQKQLSYSRIYDITLWGVSIAHVTQNESVTRISPSEFEIIEDIIPVTPGFRPGIKKNANLTEEFIFNDENIVWVVIHDTANSNVGAGAELHNRYLHEQARTNGRQASWHYTVDHKEAYRHLPDDEVGYHAGDGSSIPGIEKVSPALGGGNRNGIGIETSIQRDADMFRVWANSASLSADLLVKYNLPLSQLTYHNDFSGKECPNTLRRAGLIKFFEELVENEYNLRQRFNGQIESIELISHNPEILNNDGTIINTPNRTTQVSYDIVVKTANNETLTKTFSTLVEGLWR